MTNTKYEYIIFRNRYFAAIPYRKRNLFLEMIKRISSNSWRKKLFKIFLATLFYLRIQKFFFVSDQNYSQLINDKTLNNIEKQIKSFGFNEDELFFIFPPQMNRGRYYAYLFQKGICIAFAKVSLNTYNTQCLMNEQIALSIVGKFNLSFYLPSLITYEFSENIHCLIYEPINPKYNNYADNWDEIPFKCRNEIIGQVKMAYIKDCNWWKQLTETKADSPEVFISYLLSEQIKTLNVGFTHGDLTSNNILIKNNDVMIIDWEYFSDIGPYTVDQISFYLTKYQKIINNNPLKAVQNIFAELCKDCSTQIIPERIQNGKLALGFLYLKGNMQAKKIVFEWTNKYEDILSGL